MTLSDAIGLLPFTTAAAAAVSVALVALKVSRHPEFPYATPVIALAIAALVVLVPVGLLRRRARRPPPWLNPRGAASWLLALQLGLLLSTVSVVLLVTHVAADDRIWSWPYLNKRWLIALYMIGIGTFTLLPAAVEWWRAPGTGIRDGASATATAAPRNWMAWIGGALVIVALAWWFAGPPWHLDRHHRNFESHEEAHLGPLQAVDKGYTPYLGPASTQYGPGAQVLMYRLMRLAGPFDMVSYRTAWATIHFGAVLAMALAAYCWLGLAAAAAVVLIAAFYSPFAFYGTNPDGTFAGFYGWGSALRYLAPLIVVPTLVRAGGVTRGQQPLASPWVIALGAWWGAASWVSQENLTSTALAGGLLLALLCCTRTVPIPRALRIARDLAIGFAIAVAPVALYYFRYDALGEMLHNYFVVPQAVAAGYSNTWWPATDSGRRTFYATAPFVAALGILTLWRRPVPTLVTPLEPRRALFLAFVAIQLVCFQVSLMRSDAGHLQNTMAAMPFIVVLGVRDLPGWLASARLSRRTVRVLFVLTALAILPAGKLAMWRQTLVWPYTRFVSGGARPAAAVPDPRVAYARATPAMADDPDLWSGSPLTMRAFLDFATEIHRLAGGRKTYVGAFSQVWTGSLYFFADLTPAPYPLDRETMMINDQLRARVVEHIRSHPDLYGCYIGGSLDDPEAQAFLSAHPDAERLERPLGGRAIHVLLARNPR